MGDGVNIAARLEGIAKPGAICLSEDAYRQVKGRLDFAVTDLGPTELKNIAEPIRVYSLQVGVPAQAKHAPAPAPEKSAPPRLSIAVLPFANMSGDAEQEYFADGISEDIITALSKLPQLFVIARNSSFMFKGRHVLVTEVARSLGVGHVLEGSVRKSGSRVRITAQLIDASTGGHVWAERFDRELTDVFAVQDDVTAKIIAALAPSLSAAARQRVMAEQTNNIEAYDCFLRARELLRLHSAKDTNEQAKALLRKAIEFDPGFASAHAFLALAFFNEYSSAWSASPGQSLEEASLAARRAVELDPRNPNAQWVLAIINGSSGRFDEAQFAMEQVIADNPSFAAAHITLGVANHYAGKSEEALACFERAFTLDPNHPGVWLHFQAQALYQLGRYPEAVQVLKRRILQDPDTDASPALLAACYGQIGLIEDAREAWRATMRVNPEFSLEHRRKTMPYKNPADFERIVEGLRKAGLPDGPVKTN